MNTLTLRSMPRTYERVEDLLSGLSRPNGNSCLAVLFHKVDQNGRAYAFEFGTGGQLLTVTKIAMSPEAMIGVKHEHAVLGRLANARLSFEVPQVVDFIASEGSCMLRVNAAADGYTLHKKSEGVPEYLFNEIAALRSADAPTIQPLSTFDWVDRGLRRVTTTSIAKMAQGLEKDMPIAVCAAHRDLGSENILSNERRANGPPDFAVIDWESFTETAPLLTDRVGYWLGQRHRQFKRAIGGRPIDGLAEDFFAAFGKTEGDKQDAFLALLGLLDIGNDLAERLCGVRT